MPESTTSKRKTGPLESECGGEFQDDIHLKQFKMNKSIDKQSIFEFKNTNQSQQHMSKVKT